MCFTFQSNVKITRSQGLQAFAFCVVTVNNIPNLGPKGKVGVIYKDDLCTELRLKLWFESDWYFFSYYRVSMALKTTVEKKNFQITTF